MSTVDQALPVTPSWLLTAPHADHAFSRGGWSWRIDALLARLENRYSKTLALLLTPI